MEWYHNILPQCSLVHPRQTPAKVWDGNLRGERHWSSQYWIMTTNILNNIMPTLARLVNSPQHYQIHLPWPSVIMQNWSLENMAATNDYEIIFNRVPAIIPALKNSRRLFLLHLSALPVDTPPVPASVHSSPCLCIIPVNVTLLCSLSTLMQVPTAN